jgi:hypothetical protein
MPNYMDAILTALIFLIIGIIVRPKLLSLINKRIVRTFSQDIHRYELEFQIQFYNKPSMHQVGVNGELVKLEPIKLNIDAKSEEEAKSMLAEIVKEEIKADLLTVRKVF